MDTSSSNQRDAQHGRNVRRNVRPIRKTSDRLSSLPDEILRIVVTFATHTLREVLRLQSINTHFRRAMRQSNKVWHLMVQLRDFSSVRLLGPLALGVHAVALRLIDRRESLACLPALNILDLSYARLMGLPDVSSLTRLRSLNLEFCANIERITSLPPQLQNLNVCGCSSLVHLPSELPGLLTLNVRYCHQLVAIPSAPLLHLLDSLHCPAPLNEKMAAICTIKACHQEYYTLSNYPSLQTLSLSECAFDRTDFLASLSNLTNLRLEMLKFGHFDLAGVSGLVNLQKLELEGMVTDANLRSLEGLPRVQSLRLRSPQMTDEGMRSVAKLQELVSLELGCGHSVHVSYLGIRYLTLPKLTSLCLFACDMEDLRSLEGMVRLEHLIIFSSYRLHDLAPLAQLTKLKTVKLAYCDSVSTLSGLNRVPQLEIVDVSHCWDLQRDGLWEMLPCKLSELVLNAHARAQLGDRVEEFHKRLRDGNPRVQLIF